MVFQPVLSLTTRGRVAVGQGERRSRRDGEGPSPGPRAGGLASERKHKRFGVILGELSGMFPMMWLPVLAGKKGVGTST